MKKKADQVLAERYGIDAKTIRNNAHFAAALDKVTKLCGSQFRDWVLTRGGHGSHRNVRLLAKMGPEKMQRKVQETLQLGAWPKPFDDVAVRKQARVLRLPSGTVEERAQAIIDYLGPEEAPLITEAMAAILRGHGGSEECSPATSG